jgi:ATP-dependent DNA helicase RecG
MKAAQRRDALAAIADGSWQLVIGTHALNSSNVAYHKLGLVITDEQHRFGVRQRQKLTEQAENIVPHILALSATPIPRSLALVLYGDLQVSIMGELPPGRMPVKTRIVPADKRDDLYNYIKKKARLGEQSYLVCPLVEDNGEVENEKQSVTSLYRQLGAGPLKDIGIALTYGNQDQTEKDRALADFYSGKAAVLVSTTVIEVGMDVPNATTMVIEDAEMFGLAQLHQLRGRVGRGKKESWCFLVGEANERLTTMIQTNDGFIIAQKDLELRGPGEFLGTRQHGKMLNLYGVSDIKLIEETSRCLDEMKTGAERKEVYQYLAALAERRYGQRLSEASLN